jgi:hypothetical protein
MNLTSEQRGRACAGMFRLMADLGIKPEESLHVLCDAVAIILSASTEGNATYNINLFTDELTEKVPFYIKHFTEKEEE